MERFSTAVYCGGKVGARATRWVIAASDVQSAAAAVRCRWLISALPFWLCCDSVATFHFCALSVFLVFDVCLCGRRGRVSLWFRDSTTFCSFELLCCLACNPQCSNNRLCRNWFVLHTIFKGLSREKQAGVSKFSNVRKRDVQRKVRTNLVVWVREIASSPESKSNKTISYNE